MEVCLWLAFGAFEWADPTRAKVLPAVVVLYFLRHMVTLFVLLQRKVELAEGLGLTVFIAIFEIGFVLLGAGLVSKHRVRAATARVEEAVGVQRAVLYGRAFCIFHAY